MKRRVLFILSLCLLAARPGLARTAPPIHFTATATPSPARSGEVVDVTVRAALAPGWHVYSVVPTPGGPAATVLVSAGAWAAAGPTSEDAPIRALDPNFGATVGYHTGKAAFSRSFRVPSGARAGTVPLRVTLHYQTCNDKICLPPTDATVPVTVTLAAGSARPQYARATSVMAGGGGGGLGWFLLAALGAGLLALLTPCVFPLIPITLTSFVKQADGDRGRLMRLSSGYAAGIALLYVALGGAVTLTLGAAGVNRIAASPWVNLVLFVLFVAFALSFFEVFQFRLPGNLGALQSQARARGGTAGLLLLGVTFVLASFTCTAPFLGTLLVAAAGGARLRPLLGMAAFALAFVSPFLVFSLFPQWIGRIPRGGPWLARFKATLGFLELAAALKFLSNADQVWQWGLLTQPVLLAAWALIFVCAALYLLGPLRFGIVAEVPDPAGAARLPPARAACGGLFLAAALYCFWGLAGRPLSPYVGAFLPPAGYGGAGQGADAGLPWLSDYGTALAQARAEGRPLLVDFTGYTCTNCRLNEKAVFPRPAVQRALADYVRVQLYTDGGRDGAKNQALQEAKFGDVALPLYGVVDPQTGAAVAQTAGVQSVGGFTQFLSQSLTRAQTVAPAPAALSAPWAAYNADAVAQAAAQGRPVVVDCTAAWCVNCKAIERDVFQNPAIASSLEGGFVTLRADMTQWNSPASVALERRYGITSLPSILFLDRSGHEVKSLRVTGRLSVADFQHRMQAASPV